MALRCSEVDCIFSKYHIIFITEWSTLNLSELVSDKLIYYWGAHCINVWNPSSISKVEKFANHIDFYGNFGS